MMNIKKLRKKSKKVEELIEKYSLELKDYTLISLLLRELVYRASYKLAHKFPFSVVIL